MAARTDSKKTSLAEAKTKYEYFWKEESPFSQWYPAKFKDGNQSYMCAEQYMMHRKAVLFRDQESAMKILHSQDPKVQKSLGRKVKNWDQELWDKSCRQTVKEASRLKFSQNPNLKKILFDTFPKTLVEASPVDTIWGIGYAADHPNAWDEATWRGQNLLGYVLTEVRNDMMEEEGLKT
ncbi:N-glycosidase Npun_R5314-like [Gigantopelta aegis]|uniref:N-glycosidase Npun_R5314-like n=1 Tax=Gigantopelta aegis TaxID=1735272 RepID=UPI001B88D285|nr:N-glycosidase Npun_R5314-like [Gigantopelta aegis]